MTAHGVEALVERQVRLWELRRRRSGATAVAAPRPVVVVSAQHGARRSDLGARVASRLGYPVWDREILHEIALETNMSERMFQTLDEHRQNPITEAMAAQGIGLGTSVYMFHLLRTLRTISQHGSAVIIGRGAQFALPESEALRVRGVAPIESRVRTLMADGVMDARAARAEITRVDAEHLAFVHKHYGRDLVDPSGYDLLVNTATLGVDHAAAIIVEAYRERFGRDA